MKTTVIILFAIAGLSLLTTIILGFKGVGIWWIIPLLIFVGSSIGLGDIYLNNKSAFSNSAEQTMLRLNRSTTN
jgi:hypothetical protein